MALVKYAVRPIKASEAPPKVIKLPGESNLFMFLVLVENEAKWIMNKRSHWND